jgi:NADH-quinone oxidoreductase subunit C
MKQEEIRDRLVSVFGADIGQASLLFAGELSVTVPAEKIGEVCRFLRDDPQLSFRFLSFVGGVDRFPAEPRFELVYQLYSLRHNHRFRIKAQVEEGTAIDSVVDVWPTADWHERETAEMYGITFTNHPDPRKLLLPEEWRVYPLRKDFPLLGTEEDTPDLPSKA